MRSSKANFRKDEDLFAKELNKLGHAASWVDLEKLTEVGEGEGGITC